MNNEPAKKHFEDEPQAEELHEILQSNTHPAKTLTDKEILQVHYQMMKDNNSQLPPYVEFARAILQRASEK